MISQQQQAEVIKRIDRDELAALTKDLVDIPSPTGSEKALGEFIINGLTRHGIKSVRQEIGPSASMPSVLSKAAQTVFRS